MPRRTKLHNLSNVAIKTKEGLIVRPKTVSRRLVSTEIERALTAHGLSWRIIKGEYYTDSTDDTDDNGNGGTDGDDIHVVETIVEDEKKYLILSNGQKIFAGNALYDTKGNLIN